MSTIFTFFVSGHDARLFLKTAANVVITTARKAPIVSMYDFVIFNYKYINKIIE